MSIEQRYVELHPVSRRLNQRAASVFPDGVTHDMRHMAPFPLYVERAERARKHDVDGNAIVDFVMGHGALLLGHGHPDVTAAIAEQLARGTHYGASHELEIHWGGLVCDLVPSAQRVRFTSSGTEATMMALRLARAHTSRAKTLRLREHFHGWNDSVMGQPAAEDTVPVSPGLPRGMLESSIVIPANDIEALERTIEEEGAEIAALIFESTGAHWGTEPLDLAYVQRARELTAERGIVLIMDEVITGFRVTPGGAQQAYGVTPDLTTLAKIIAGGLPGGAVAGRTEIVERIASRHNADGRVEHPGTFNANPLSAAAGSACLSLLADGAHQQRASVTAARIARGINAVFEEESVAGCCYGQASMLHIALGFDARPPDGYSWGWSALPSPPPRVAPGARQALRMAMINEGVDLMSEGMMVSSMHADDDADRTIEAFRHALRAMKEERLV